MIERSFERYLGIAIDHGDSFNKWLSTWGADPSSRAIVKRGIISVCLEAGISGIVVGIDLYSGGGLESVIKVTAEYGTDTWIGLPDQIIQGQFDAARSSIVSFPIEPSLRMAKDIGAAGIKIGMSLERHARWSDVVAWLRPPASMAQRLGLSLIVEPYFRVDDDVSDRVGFLTAIHEIDCVRFAKLDVHEPQVWSQQYGRAFSPWLARSEGLQFSSFCNGVEQSLNVGCVGTMVGAAVWGIRQKPLLGTSFTDELLRRLALLRNLVKPQHSHA